MGVITTDQLLKTLGNFAGTNEIGGIIVLEMERSQFTISRNQPHCGKQRFHHPAPEYHRSFRNRHAHGNHTP